MHEPTQNLSLADLFEFLLLLIARQLFLLLETDREVLLVQVLMIAASLKLRVFLSHQEQQARSYARPASLLEQRVRSAHTVLNLPGQPVLLALTALSHRKRRVHSCSRVLNHLELPAHSYNRVPWKVNFPSTRVYHEVADLSNPSLKALRGALVWSQGSSVASLLCTPLLETNRQCVPGSLSSTPVLPTGMTLTVAKHTSLLFLLLSHLSALSSLVLLHRLLIVR